MVYRAYIQHTLSIYSAYIENRWKTGGKQVESRWKAGGKLLVRSKIKNDITHRMQKHSVDDICYTNYSLLVVHY
jgi:hypothetical protein